MITAICNKIINLFTNKTLTAAENKPVLHSAEEWIDKFKTETPYQTDHIEWLKGNIINRTIEDKWFEYIDRYGNPTSSFNMTHINRYDVISLAFVKEAMHELYMRATLVTQTKIKDASIRCTNSSKLSTQYDNMLEVLHYVDWSKILEQDERLDLVIQFKQISSKGNTKLYITNELSLVKVRSENDQETLMTF